MGIRIAPDERIAADYKELINSLPDGKKSAVPMKSLADAYGMKTAELRAFILKSRIDGVLILSGQQGFYLPENRDEIREYVTRRRQYIRTAQKALDAFESELKRIGEGCADD